MIFKKLLLLLAVLLLTCSIHAQKTQELGVTFSALNNFGIIYKKQLKKETRYLRLSGANFYFGDNGNDVSIGLGVSMGWENRKEINEKFNFIHGPQIGISANSGVFSNDLVARITPSFGYILGAQYKLNNDFYINLEVIPSISTSFITGFPEETRFQVYGNLNAATLGIVYTFKKKEKNKK